MNSKAKYFLRSLVNIGQKPVCPFCNGEGFKVIDKKYVVTRLLECNECHLYYRHPRDRSDFNAKFYQEEYEEVGITTHLPGPDELKKLKETNFKGSEKDYQGRVDIIKTVIKDNRTIKLVDYGTSWGYASFQFKNAGMQVQSSEISVSRAAFGNKNLGLNIVTDENKLLPGNDVFFSSHVIEHHPDVKGMTELAKKLLLPDGYYMAFCPNGSDTFRTERFAEFHHIWGLAHPNYLNSKFFHHVFANNPYFIGSNYTDPELLKTWDGHSQVVGNLGGVELYVISRPHIQL